MATTDFTDDTGSNDGTLIVAAWLDDVDFLTYNIFNGPTTVGADGVVWVSDGTKYVEESGATLRTSIGVGTGDTVQFTAIELGHATANTLTGSAGDLSIEGNIVYRAGGTDVPVTDGGTGRSTSTTAYGLIAAGTTATGAHQTLPLGATTEILVGGGAGALPAWTTATGSGAPVRATSPALVTPTLGVATGTSFQGIIGNVTPAAGTFTDLVATGAITLGDNAADVFTATSDKIVTSLTGGLNLPLQSSFSAFLSATQTDKTGNGAGSTYTVIFDTEIYDQNSDYNAGTGVFTAPVAGRYNFNAGLDVVGCTIATGAYITLVTSNRSWELGALYHTAGSMAIAVGGGATVDMDAGDTAYITVVSQGEAGVTDDIYGSASPVTYFSGYLAH